MALDCSRSNVRPAANDAGLTLIEVCLAMLILSTAALAAARLSVVSVNLIVSARLQSETTTLAVQKAEQLRSLAWRFVDVGVLQPVSDSTTDLSQEPMTGGGGGLSPSPTGTLSANTPGYVDYVDKHGRWVGTGPVPPGSAVFIRRWNVAALPSNPSDSLVLRVLVTTVVRDSQSPPTSPRRRLGGDATVVTVLTRKAG
jgi:hypothetical protein